MPDVLWGALQVITVLALASSTGLAFIASGRIGRHTPYGTFLFVMALGFWFLLVGLVTYIATRAIGAWHGAPGWGDAYTLVGWALLTLSFYLLLLRFPGTAPVRRQRHRVTLLLLALGTAMAALVLVRDAHYGSGGVDSAIRSAYLFLDGVAVGAIILSVRFLYRLRHASLAHLYTFLGIGLLIKTAGDLLFLFWPDAPPIGFPATALYSVAGLIVVAGLIFHHHAMAGLDTRRVLANPGFTKGQLVLRDAAIQMRGLAGEMGGRLVLQAAHAWLTANGFPATTRDGVVYSKVTHQHWAGAVNAARQRSVAVLGQPGEAVFARVCAAYGHGQDQELP